MRFRTVMMRISHSISKVFLACAALVSSSVVTIVTASENPSTNAISAEEIRRLAKTQQTDAIKLYREILSFPNDAAYPNDILKLVDWLEPELSKRGFKTHRIETAGSPVVFAERMFEGAEKTALIYLQADGQPVDAALWNQESPFKAILKKQSAGGVWEAIDWPLDNDYNPEWRIFARSASDSKGPIIQFLSAVDGVDSAGIRPSYNFKVIIDTEEEKGSPHLQKAVQENIGLFTADFLFVFDGPPHASNEPTLVFGARGLTTITLTAYGSAKPQHSGHYGNFTPNPASHLARILGSAKDADGRVLIDGFYDGIKIDRNTEKLLNAVPDDEAEMLADMKLAAADRVGRTLQEAIQYPTFNIRGLSSGWVGDEARTIIPATAIAEIDIRTVPETDPVRLVNLVRTHIEELGYYVIDRPPTDEERRTLPRIVSMTHRISYGAFRTDIDSLAGNLALGAMNHLNGEEPILIRILGGSSPIAIFADALNVPTVLVPTVNIDNNQHAPDENIRVGSFFEGIAIMISILSYGGKI